MRKDFISDSTKTSIELEWICRATLQASFPSFRGLEIKAIFYPYIGLTHTIRRRKGGWLLRISDHCAHAPRVVLEAIALLLACKVLRRTPPAQMVRVYDRFRKDPEIEWAVDWRRRHRGRKVFREDGDKHHDLTDVYRELNQRHFNGQIDIRQLGWSQRRSWGRLGHYDPVHHTITISPVLDSPRVPRAVLAYIVYHEMLHTLFDARGSSGRKRHHPPEFRRAERGYPGYQEARRFLNKFCQSRGKRTYWSTAG